MKTANPRFVEIYRAKWTVIFGNGQFYGTHWHASVWRQAFSGYMLANLPVTSGAKVVKQIVSYDGSLVVTLKLYPSGPKGSRKHRVFVWCDKCNKDVQAGRIDQHRC